MWLPRFRILYPHSEQNKKWPSTSRWLRLGGVSSGLAQARRSHGARGTSLTVAAVKPWRGSRACAAWDPAFNATPWEIGPCALPRGGIPPRYGGLRVQGTASSPCSTTTANMVCRQPPGVKRADAPQPFRSHGPLRPRDSELVCCTDTYRGGPTKSSPGGSSPPR